MENTKSPISQILLFQQLNNDTIPNNQKQQLASITTNNNWRTAETNNNKLQQLTINNQQPTTTTNHYNYQWQLPKITTNTNQQSITESAFLFCLFSLLVSPAS